MGFEPQVEAIAVGGSQPPTAPAPLGKEGTIVSGEHLINGGDIDRTCSPTMEPPLPSFAMDPFGLRGRTPPMDMLPERSNPTPVWMDMLAFRGRLICTLCGHINPEAIGILTGPIGTTKAGAGTGAT